MKKLLELRQKKSALKVQMKAMLESAEKENRSLNDDEGKKFDELCSQATSLNTDIERLETVADEERSQSGHSPKNNDRIKALNTELRQYLKKGENRSLTTQQDMDGGYTVIPELDDEREIDQPELWIKANPNLNVSVDEAKLDSTIQKVRGIPSQWVEMMTKRFNIWCQGSTPWMGAGAWER